jgi:hypothetical protein
MYIPDLLKQWSQIDIMHNVRNIALWETVRNWWRGVRCIVNILAGNQECAQLCVYNREASQLPGRGNVYI